jgi:hypothetical protein
LFPSATLLVVKALKEWAVVCDLLLAGRQSILLRKGGIGEGSFWIEAAEFLLFPSAYHQNRDRLRREHHTAFEAAAAGAPPADVVRLHGLARVVDAVEVRRRDGIGLLEDLHPYTEEHVRSRFDFRPGDPLVVLVVEAAPLVRVAELPMLEEYRGCVSWVDVPVERPEVGPYAAAELRAAAGRVRALVG